MPFSLRRWIASIDQNTNVKLEPIDVSAYCRTCLNETIGTDFYTLDSTDNVTLGNETIDQILQKLIGIDFVEVDYTETIRSNRICLSCYDLLTRCYVFRNECLQSHNALQKYRELMRKKELSRQGIESGTPTITEPTTTATYIELNKDTDASAESVVIKVEVDDEELMYTVIEDDSQDEESDTDSHEIDEQNPLMEVTDEQSGDEETQSLHSPIRETCSTQSPFSGTRVINSMAPVDDPVEEHRCLICNRIFPKRKQLNKHLNAHMPDNRCSYCYKYFAQKYVLRRHLENHSELRPYKAICCYKRFKRRDDMQSHVKNHTSKMENQQLAYLMLKQSDLITVNKSSRIRNAPAKLQAATIHVYDVSKALPVNKKLAEEYIIDSENIVEMCIHNKNVAKKHGNTGTVQCWTLAHLIASSITNNNGDSVDDETIFQQIPFPKILLESLISHFAQNHDLQSAAMLCCAFGRHCPAPSEISRSSSLSGKSLNTSPSGSPYHTIMPVDSKSNQSTWNLAMQWKQLRSNSWSDSLDDCRIVPAIDINRTLLGDSQRHLYDCYKRVYAEMLYRWNLLLPRAKILKYISVPAEAYRDVEFVAECSTCMKVTRAAVCKECHNPMLKCSLCRLPVKGLANACLSCGHGGHTDHMKKWFSKNDSCAFGCGCQCMNYVIK